MKFKSIIPGIVLLFFSLAVKGQQDPLYSQYMFNPLAINPAYTGINNHLNIAAITRFQWLNAFNDGSPQTIAAVAHTSLLKQKIGVGAMLISDQLGITNNTEGHLSYSYKIVSPEMTISFGLQTGFVQLQNDYNSLTLKFLDDPNFIPSDANATKFTFGAGAAIMTDSYFIGVSVPRLLTPEFDDGITTALSYDRHYYLMGSFIQEISPSIKFKPSALLKAVSGAPLSYDINANFLFQNNIWGGIFTRNFNSFGIMAQLEINTAYRIGYAYERLGAEVATTGFSTHEIVISVDLPVLPDHAVFQRFF